MLTETADFDQLQSDVTQRGADAALEALATSLRAQGRHHELFDARLMQARCRLGLPTILTSSLDELAEPMRSKVEEAYLAACREVGFALLAQGKIRESWMYLRPLGEPAEVARELAKIEADDDNSEELIEISLNEGVDPVRGFSLLLKSYGTCNAITTFESEIGRRGKQHQQQAAEILIRHLHGELVETVRQEVRRQEGNLPRETTLAELVAERDWLFLDNNYHTDTTHLAAICRFARLVDAAEPLRLALDLTAYGKSLSAQYQFVGEEPFVDFYKTHALFFRAMLGEEVEPALAYFRERAENADPLEHGTAPLETYVILLAHRGRYAEGLEVLARLLPQGARTSQHCPTMLELSQLAGDYATLMAVCRERNDLLGYAAGAIEATKVR